MVSQSLRTPALRLCGYTETGRLWFSCTAQAQVQQEVSCTPICWKTLSDSECWVSYWVVCMPWRVRRGTALRWNKFLKWQRCDVGRLRLLGRIVLRRIFHSKKEVTADSRKLRNEKLRNFHCSRNIIRVIKSRKTEHVDCLGVMRNACRLLVGKPEGKRLWYREEVKCFMRPWTEFICLRITAINGPVLPH